MKEQWVITVDNEIKGNLIESSHIAYQNGCDLLTDAKLLYDNSRYARAAALSILSEEEFSKAFMLFICGHQHRWDSVIYNGIKDHGPKQAVVEGMPRYFNWIETNIASVAKMNQFSFIPAIPSLIPSPDTLSELFTSVKKEFMDQKQRDKYKQNLTYVDIDKKAKVSNDPKKVKKEDADKSIKRAERFQKIIDMLYEYFDSPSNLKAPFR